MRRGKSASSVPNCSAMTSGAWFGSITPPAPTRMVDVAAATCPMTTEVAALATPAGCGVQRASNGGSPTFRLCARGLACSAARERRRCPSKPVPDPVTRTESCRRYRDRFSQIKLCVAFTSVNEPDRAARQITIRSKPFCHTRRSRRFHASLRGAKFSRSLSPSRSAEDIGSIKRLTSPHTGRISYRAQAEERR